MITALTIILYIIIAVFVNCLLEIYYINKYGSNPSYRELYAERQAAGSLFWPILVIIVLFTFIYSHIIVPLATKVFNIYLKK